MFEIKHINGNILFKSETALNVKDCLIDAVKSRADLRGVDLQRVDLQRVNLQGVSLRGADLRGAYLRGADIRGADLHGADLRGADLHGADLHEEKQSIAPYLISNLFESYEIVITRNSMAVGCKIYTHAEWKGFDDDTLLKIAQSDMGDKYPEETVNAFKLLRPTLLKLCSAHKKASDAVAAVAQLESEASK